MRTSSMVSVNPGSAFRAERSVNHPQSTWIVVETMPRGSVSERSDRDRAILGNLDEWQARAIVRALNGDGG